MSAEEWLVEIDNALEFRESFAMENKWASLERDYLNDPNSNTAIGPNLIYSMGDSLLGSLNIPDPEIVVTAEHPAGVDRAPVVEYVDNWFIKKLKMKRVVDAASLQCYLTSKGIVKIGYDSEFGWDSQFDIGREQSAGLTLTQYHRRTGNRIEEKNTTPGMPWVSLVLSKDFVVPWGTQFLDDAPWCACRIIRKNSYFKADPKYKNTSRLEPQITMEQFMGSYTQKKIKRQYYTSQDTFEANRRVDYNEAWEIHDRMSGKVYVVVRDYDKFLRDTDNALLVAGLPFVDISFVNHPRAFWSTPQAYYLGQIQATQFDIHMQAEKQRRLNNFRILAKKGLMKREELTKLLSGDAGAFAFADTNEPLRDAFIPVPQGSMGEFAAQSEWNRQDAREAVGFGRNQVGDYQGKTHITKAETQNVQAGSERRTGRRFGGIQTMYTDIITKLNKICFSFWKLPRFAMVDNEWVKFTPQELRGDYLYDTSLSTKRNLSRAQRKVEAMMMTAQFMQMGLASPQLFKYLQDAANDPAFSNILAPMIGKGGGQGAPGSSQPQPQQQQRPAGR